MVENLQAGCAAGVGCGAAATPPPAPFRKGRGFRFAALAPGSKGLGLLLVALSTVAWSTAGYFTRLVETDTLTTSFWRSLFGGLFLGAFAAVRLRGRLWRELATLGLGGWSMVLSAGTGMICFIGALKLTTVADVAVIYAALPFLAAPLAWAWLGERPSRRTMVGGLVALGGVAVMMGGARLGGSLAGDLLALLQTCSMAYAVVAVRRFRRVPLVLAICLGNFLSCLLTAAAGASLAVDAGDLAVLAVFGAVQVALGSILFALGSRRAPAAETALICTVEAPLTPFWVWLAFGEVPPATTFAGGALVLGASLAQMLRRRSG